MVLKEFGLVGATHTFLVLFLMIAINHQERANLVLDQGENCFSGSSSSMMSVVNKRLASRICGLRTRWMEALSCVEVVTSGEGSNL